MGCDRFVLREVFDVPYGDIADAIEKSPDTVRQIARRARDHVAERRPRMRVSRCEQEAVVERFLVAMRTGQVQALMEVLAPDVILIADGGGLVPAIRVPVHGRDRVARLLARAHDAPVTLEPSPVWLNGAPAVRVEFDGELGAAVSLVLEEGRITRIYIVRNPTSSGIWTSPRNSPGSPGELSVVPVEVVRPRQREQMPVGPGVVEHLGHGRSPRQCPVVPREARMRALVPRVDRQGVEQPRGGGALSDGERVSGQELVVGQSCLEHAVGHVEPAARVREGALVEALLDRVVDDRLDLVRDVLVAEAVP